MLKRERVVWSMLLALLLSAALVMSAFAADAAPSEDGEYWWQQYQENPEDDLTMPGVNEDGQVITTGGYVLFGADPHSAGHLAKDLLELANEVVKEDGEETCVSLFALGGDYADNGLLPDVMTIIKHAITDTSPDTSAVIIPGNHETYSDEEYKAITGMSRIGETAVNSDGLYHFFSFGTAASQAFGADDIAQLSAYLESLTDDKPVFVLSHYPIHYLNSQRNAYGDGAAELLEVLNQYPQVIYTWAHYHSEADPSYGTVRFPGETLTYGPDPENTVELKFTYASMGSIRYGVNGENGLLVKVNEDGTVNFRFLSLEQKPADDIMRADSSGTPFETLVATNPHVLCEVTRPVLDEEYYKTIFAAHVFIDEPLVGYIPAALEDVLSFTDRYTVEDLVWSANGEPIDPSAEYDFNTAYTATVTLKAKDGYKFDLGVANISGINPSYHGPMDEAYNAGDTIVTAVDDTTVVMEYTFANTVEAFDPPLSPATSLEEGHSYVMASIDDTSVIMFYQYEYQEGARRQNMKPWPKFAVVRDGKLASKPGPYEIYYVTPDYTGYLIWSDASFLDHAYGDNSLETLNILRMTTMMRMVNIDTETGAIAINNNWNMDENGLPYVNVEGLVIYPYTDGTSISGVTDPAQCNLRLFDMGETDPGRYIVVCNITLPVAGEPVDYGTEEQPVNWSPADEVFQPGTQYTATVEVKLETPVKDETAAVGRMNGEDVDIAFSEDGLTATLSRTYPATNTEPAPLAGATATKAEAIEAGKVYMIVTADGIAMTTMTSPDGLYFLGEDVTVEDGTIKDGITEEMLFAMGTGDKSTTFYPRTNRGYLIGKQTTPETAATWGVAFSEEPAMSVSYANGYLTTAKTGVPGAISFGANYFYYYDGHFNFSDFVDGTPFEIYEVSLPEEYSGLPLLDVEVFEIEDTGDEGDSAESGGDSADSAGGEGAEEAPAEGGEGGESAGGEAGGEGDSAGGEGAEGESTGGEGESAGAEGDSAGESAGN